MNVEELLTAVRDEHLTKPFLEKYRDALTHIHTDMQKELATIEKAEAIFFHHMMTADPDESDIRIKRRWKASKAGLRQIDVKRSITAVVKEIDSLKSRLFSIY